MLRENYESHAVWQNIEKIEAVLEGFSDTAKNDLRFLDLSKKTEFVRWILKNSEPVLFSTAELDKINRGIENVAENVPNDAFDWLYFSEIETYFSQIFQIVPYARVQKIFKTDANSFFEECELKVFDLKSDADAQLAVLTEKADDLATSLQETAENIEELKVDLTKSNDDIEDQFGNWETRLDTEIKEKLGALAETFSGAQTKRREGYESLLNEISETLRNAQSNTDTTMSVNKKQIDEAKAELVEYHKKAVVDADDILDKIKRIYEVVGKTALAGEFVDAAKSEEKSYKFYSRAASFAYIFATGAFAYLVFSQLKEADFSLTKVVAQIPTAVIFFAPAIYFSTLAQRHHRVEISLRSLGIRIATFDAYLANFDDAEKNAEKQKMTEVFFDAKISSERTQPTDTKDLGKALDQLTGPLGKVLSMAGRKE